MPRRALLAADCPARARRTFRGRIWRAWAPVVGANAVAAGALFVEAPVATPAIRRRFHDNQGAYARLVSAWTRAHTLSFRWSQWPCGQASSTHHRHRDAAYRAARLCRPDRRRARHVPGVGARGSAVSITARRRSAGSARLERRRLPVERTHPGSGAPIASTPAAKRVDLWSIIGPSRRADATPVAALG